MLNRFLRDPKGNLKFVQDAVRILYLFKAIFIILDRLSSNCQDTPAGFDAPSGRLRPRMDARDNKVLEFETDRTRIKRAKFGIVELFLKFRVV